MTPSLEWLAFATGAVAVFLGVRENPWTWPVGFVNAALYGIVFVESKLYADAGLQVVYAVLALYGAQQWLRGGATGKGVAVRHVRPREGLVLAGLAASGALLLATLLRRTDASFPTLDSVLTGGSLAAQWMTAKKWVECWTVWLAVDVVYVGLFAAKALYLTAGLYALFCGLAVMGARRWRRGLVT